MDDQAWFNAVAGIAVVVVLVAAGVVIAVAPGGPLPQRTAGPGPSGPTVFRNLTISYAPSAGGFVYDQAALQVPMNVRVVFTITTFDPSAAVLPTVADAKVTGTLGGTMQVIGGSGNVTVEAIPPSEVGHTFSLSDAYYHVSVPVPVTDAAPGGARVAFSVVFPSPGTYVWGCVVLCGAADMHAAGAMYGTLTVS